MVHYTLLLHELHYGETPEKKCKALNDLANYPTAKLKENEVVKIVDWVISDGIKNSDKAVQLAAMHVLEMIKHEKTIAPLFELFLYSKDRDVSVASIFALGRKGDMRVFSSLIAFLGDENSSIRQDAAHVLAYGVIPKLDTKDAALVALYIFRMGIVKKDEELVQTFCTLWNKHPAMKKMLGHDLLRAELLQPVQKEKSWFSDVSKQLPPDLRTAMNALEEKKPFEITRIR